MNMSVFIRRASQSITVVRRGITVTETERCILPNYRGRESQIDMAHTEKKPRQLDCNSHKGLHALLPIFMRDGANGAAHGAANFNR